MSEITSKTYYASDCTSATTNNLAYGWSPFTTTTATATISANQMINNLISVPESYPVFKDELLTVLGSQAIKEIIELVPQKVYKITFYNKKSVKTILDSNDTFDPEYMLFLAYAKMLYSKTLTFEGVLNKSYQLQYEKKYVKYVKDGLKLFKKIQEDKKKKEEEEAIKKRKHEKLVAKKKAAKERKRKDKINLIAEAIRLSKEEG